MNLHDSVVLIFNWVHWPFRRAITGEICDRTIVMDYMKIENAELHRCQIVYYGGRAHCVNVTFDQCEFEFGGKAGAALALLKMADEAGGSEMIRKTFPHTYG